MIISAKTDIGLASVRADTITSISHHDDGPGERSLIRTSDGLLFVVPGDDQCYQQLVAEWRRLTEEESK